jgi:hypothetical protein
LRDGLAWSPDQYSVELISMSAQEGGSKRNFIAILNDKNDEQRMAASPAHSDRRVRDYILGLMAAMLSRRGEPK